MQNLEERPSRKRVHRRFVLLTRKDFGATHTERSNVAPSEAPVACLALARAKLPCTCFDTDIQRCYHRNLR